MDQGSTALIGTVVSTVYEQRNEQSHRLARFRMVVAPRRFDRSSGSWVEQEASYFTVVLARALAADPAYHICDEATAMLDAATTASLVAVIRERAAAGLGVLAISHDHALLRAWADDTVDLRHLATTS